MTMNDPIREALYAVADIIECTYAHDENGRTDQPGEYSGADIVESLCGIEEEVSAAIMVLDGQGRAVSDLPKEALEAIVAIVLDGFDVNGEDTSWDNKSVADRAFCMLRSYGLFGR
jgi:hypothetical protein